MSALFPEMAETEKSGAVISECGKYRYHLWRRWDMDLPTMVWVMLNPSTADATEDDPTIRRCIGFAKREGCGGISVLNVFAYRATDPVELTKVADPVGPKNEAYLCYARNVSLMTILVCGWGKQRPGKVLREAYRNAGVILTCRNAHCFGKNQDGSPKHPLYLPSNAKLEEWRLHDWKLK
jgi:hypothetical protein